MSTFRCEDHSIDDLRPIRVIIIGAGPCGIISAIRLRQRIKNVSIQIFEKNDNFGGTWHQHRYPGVAADIPVMSYQLTFEPNGEWTSMYPSGQEIGDYFKRVAQKYRLYDLAKFGHRVNSANWDHADGKWRIVAEHDGAEIHDEADFLFNCMGQFNNWKWPDIPDRESYQGTLMHSANWDKSYDFQDKKVALIGSGSTAVQLLPKLQPLAKHIDIYIRNQMWLSPPFCSDYILEKNPELADSDFAIFGDLARQFKDPDFYHQYRKGMEARLNSIHGFTLLDHPVQTLFREFMTKSMETLPPEIRSKILPTFPPGCRRVTPDTGFLKALVQENVTLKSQEIEKFTQTGLDEDDYDAIVCATGYNSFIPPFPIMGLKGDLRENLPQTYLSVAVGDFPNMLMITGPNSEVGTGHSMIVFEKVADYAVKCVAKAQFEHIKSMTPSATAVSDFMTYLNTYFTNGRTVYGEKCRSTYRSGNTEGPSTALWPGSVLHLLRTLQEPRWQDYDYEYLNKDCMFGYLGNGWTDVELKGGDTAYYLDDIDIPALN